MKRIITRIAAIVLTVLVTSLCCISIYLFDNKYTHHTVQPANGLLAVSEQDLNNCIYLINGWSFYPDVLLTPEDFQNGAPDQYMVYTSIGENTHFDQFSTSDDPHSCGTYMLYLSLPEKTDTYALELPEIFSAYRLYINDRFMLQVGNPDTENYQPRTQNRTVFFDASRSAFILIQVSDFSHFYSGIVYPPAFGRAHTVSQLTALRLGLTLFVDTIVLLLAVLALYFGLRMGYKNTLLYFSMCIMTCVFTSYQLIHTVFQLPVFPTYTLELSSGYVLMLLTIILHNRICDISLLPRRISAITASLICIAAFLYGACSDMLTAPAMHAFSILVFCYKLAAAVYLLITAYHSFDTRIKYSGPLYYASIIYATIFLWERILPDYEPIFGGWLPEWGSLVLVFTIGCVMWRDIISTYANSRAFEEEHHQVARQLAMQTAYMKKISGQNEENRRLTHDFRQHLRTITGLAGRIEPSGNLPSENTALNELTSYLARISQQTTPAQPVFRTFCSNMAVDALLQYYHAAASENGIQMECTLPLPKHLPLSDIELCSVFGNLLENALDACSRNTKGSQFIVMTAKETERLLFISVENTYDGTFLREGDRFLSLKSSEKRHGIGIESVRETVERHGGSLNLYPMETVFRAGIILPLSSAPRQ